MRTKYKKIVSKIIRILSYEIILKVSGFELKYVKEVG